MLILLSNVNETICFEDDIWSKHVGVRIRDLL